MLGSKAKGAVAYNAVYGSTKNPSPYKKQLFYVPGKGAVKIAAAGQAVTVNTCSNVDWTQGLFGMVSAIVPAVLVQTADGKTYGGLALTGDVTVDTDAEPLVDHSDMVKVSFSVEIKKSVKAWQLHAVKAYSGVRGFQLSNADVTGRILAFPKNGTLAVVLELVNRNTGAVKKVPWKNNGVVGAWRVSGSATYTITVGKHTSSPYGQTKISVKNVTTQ